MPVDVSGPDDVGRPGDADRLVDVRRPVTPAGRGPALRPVIDTGGDRLHRRAAVAIGAVSVAVFWWFVTLGREDLLASRPFSGVFDLQARALLAGRLAVPDGSLGFEGFVIDGRTYAYFGVFPSVIRMPVLAVTDRFDGRLTAPSMLVALVVALWATSAIIERTRRLLRPGRAWTVTGQVVAGTLLAVVGLGSSLFFLASGAWVYHEAALWGAASVLAAFAAILAFLEHGRFRAIVVAGVWTLVAWSSRGSVGIAPSVVLGLLGLAHLTGHRWLSVVAPPPPDSLPDSLVEPAVVPSAMAPDRRASSDDRLGPDDQRTPDDRRVRRTPQPWSAQPRIGVALLVAAMAGALVFAAVNTAKFGSPTRLPLDQQLGSATPWPGREAALEAYDGSLFSARLVPSVAYQALRPDLLVPSATWPFLQYSYAPPPVWGDLVFDTVEPSAGLTVTSPLLLVLGTIGGVAALRRRGRAVDATLLRPFLLGGAAAVWGPLTIAFIAQRYHADALPLLLVASAGAVAVIDGWAAGRSADDRPRRRLALGAVVALAVTGIVATVAVTWLFQRFVIPPDAEAETAALRVQARVGEVLGSPPAVVAYPDRLPDRAPGRQYAVVGDCDGLYRGRGDGSWVPLEVAATGGRHRLMVSLGSVGDGEPVTVLTSGSAGDRLAVVVEGAGDGRVRFSTVRDGVVSSAGDPVAVDGSAQEVEVHVDPAFPSVGVFVDGEGAFFTYAIPPRPPVVSIGSDPDGALTPYPNEITVLATPTPTCKRLVAADR